MDKAFGLNWTDKQGHSHVECCCPRKLASYLIFLEGQATIKEIFLTIKEISFLEGPATSKKIWSNSKKNINQ
jgi:hypothetical protein